MTHIDLHIHSTCSDGKFTPKQIVDEAIKNNVLYFSIADHDTVSAYTDELFEQLKDKNICLIPAVEISTKFNGVGIHVLGYNIDVTNEFLIKRLYEIRNTRHIYLEKVTRKLEELGYKVNFGINYFPEKNYKGVIYEEGYYESLVVTLGSGNGENWWCVLFPPLCLMEGEETNTDEVEYKSFVKEMIDKYF